MLITVFSGNTGPQTQHEILPFQIYPYSSYAWGKISHIAIIWLYIKDLLPILFRSERIKRNFYTQFSCGVFLISFCIIRTSTLKFHCLRINRRTENIDTDRALTTCGKGILANQFQLCNIYIELRSPLFFFYQIKLLESLLAG